MHIIFSQEDWLPVLHSVSEEVGVEGKMCTNPKLMKFLEIQRKSSSLKEQFTLLNIFDDIVPSIKELYDSKLAREEAERDEFGEDISINDIVSGVPIQVGMFFDRVFLPHCIYYMYKVLLSECETEPEILFQELFRIGAGSVRQNLSPEVTALCFRCVEEKCLSLSLKDDADIRRVNIQFFKCQQKDNFFLRSSSSVTESDSDKVYRNPFESSVVESVNNSDGFGVSAIISDVEIYEYNCEVCLHSFPASEFLELHMKVFHSGKNSSNGVDVVSSINRLDEATHLVMNKGRKLVRPSFVGNVDCMITSFHNADSSEVEEHPVLSDPAKDKRNQKFIIEADVRRVKYNLRSKL